MADARDSTALNAERGVRSDWAERAEALAASDALKSAVSLFHRERKWINERHLELCRTPALTFREQQRAELLGEMFADLGLAAQIDEAGNVVAPIIFDKRLPFVAMTAHLDTALAPARPRDIYVDPDGTMRGPGVTDNGVGLAALLAVARALGGGVPAAKPWANVLLVGNTAEEGEGNLYGMKHLCNQSRWAERIKAYLVIDGASTSHITIEALGSRRFEIALEARGGHSWNDFGRVNPVHALGRAVSALADIELPSSPRATLTAATIEGGSGVNAIPASARAKIDIRSRDEATIDRLASKMEDAVRRAVEQENRRSSDRMQSVRIREIGHRPAAPRSDANWMIDCLQAVDSQLGVRSRLDCASTDANVPLAAGLPAATIGAGGRGGDAHAPTEWYQPEGRAVGLQRVYLALALTLECGA